MSNDMTNDMTKDSTEKNQTDVKDIDGPKDQKINTFIERLKFIYSVLELKIKQADDNNTSRFLVPLSELQIDPKTVRSNDDALVKALFLYPAALNNECILHIHWTHYHSSEDDCYPECCPSHVLVVIKETD